MKGSGRVVAGCRLAAPVNPAVHEPPFQPLQIRLGKLAPVGPAFDAMEPGVRGAD